MGPDKVGRTALGAPANNPNALSMENETGILTALTPTSVVGKMMRELGR